MTSAAAPADAEQSAAPAEFDLDAGWRLHPGVALRPEPFGALLYHFHTRKLSFLKSPTIVEVVRILADHPTASAACRAAGITDPQRLTMFERALATLAATETIRERHS